MGKGRWSLMEGQDQMAEALGTRLEQHCSDERAALPERGGWYCSCLRACFSSCSLSFLGPTAADTTTHCGVTARPTVAVPALSRSQRSVAAIVIGPERNKKVWVGCPCSCRSC